MLIKFLRILLFAVSALVAVALGFEFFKSTEVIPATIFIVLLSLSGLCMGWARVNVLAEKEQTRVYLSGVDLFVSALFALSSMPLLWVADQFKTQLPSLVGQLLRGAHVVLVVITLILGSRAISRLLSMVEKSRVGDDQD